MKRMDYILIGLGLAVVLVVAYCRIEPEPMVAVPVLPVPHYMPKPEGNEMAVGDTADLGPCAECCPSHDCCKCGDCCYSDESTLTVEWSVTGWAEVYNESGGDPSGTFRTGGSYTVPRGGCDSTHTTWFNPTYDPAQGGVTIPASNYWEIEESEMTSYPVAVNYIGYGNGDCCGGVLASPDVMCEGEDFQYACTGAQITVTVNNNKCCDSGGECVKTADDACPDGAPECAP